MSQYCINIENYPKDFYESLEVHEPIYIAHLWKNPKLYSKYKSHKIVKTTFSLKIWYFYYEIGRRMYENSIREFNESTVYSFLNSQNIESGKRSFYDIYIDYGGFTTIETLLEEASGEVANDEYHFNEMQKFESLRNLADSRIINTADDDFVKMLCSMSLVELQSYMLHMSKLAFSQINSGEVVVSNITEGIDETIEELDEGTRVGLAFFEAPRLNSAINGMKLGNMMLTAFSSGVGKSSFVTEKMVIAVFEHNIKTLFDETGEMQFEKAAVFVNEEGKKQWQARLLATVMNRVFKRGIPRKEISRGHFSEETKQALKEAADWLKQAGNEKGVDFEELIKIVVLKKYRVESVLSQIELLRGLGYKILALDTFKPDTSSGADRWLAFSNSAQEIHDLIKEEALNCFLMATVQLKIGKEFRYLDLDALGKSPEIAEVSAVVAMGRVVFDDEYDEGKHAIQAYNLEKQEDGSWKKVKYRLKDDKKYLILFLSKNREGSEDIQILYEMNLDFNSWKEVAWAKVKNVGRAGA